MAFYDTLRAAALRVLGQILGGLALILLIGALLITYGLSVGSTPWGL